MAPIVTIGDGAEPQEALQDALQKLASMSTADLLKARLDRLMAYGRVKEQAR
ncbi:MAG: hypothetical protein V5B38_02465 [Candidatus Accumulibacter propinquus]